MNVNTSSDPIAIGDEKTTVLVIDRLKNPISPLVCNALNGINNIHVDTQTENFKLPNHDVYVADMRGTSPKETADFANSVYVSNPRAALFLVCANDDFCGDANLANKLFVNKFRMVEGISVIDPASMDFSPVAAHVENLETLRSKITSMWQKVETMKGSVDSLLDAKR